MKASLFFVFPVMQVLAHCEISQPFPFKSRFNPANQATQNIDFSMTSPLAADGSNFPCKGYHTALDSTPISAILKAGGTLPMIINQGAVHGGGSCELSISLDKGKTFAVIQRFVGACPLTPVLNVNIPKDLPSSDKAILAWTWNNRIGNRELYMNCIPVAIENPDASIRSYTGPGLFRSNTFADGTCITPEGIDVQYPHINSVQTVFAGQMSPASPETVLENCPRDLSRIITITSDGGIKSGSNPSPGVQKPPQDAGTATQPIASSSAFDELVSRSSGRSPRSIQTRTRTNSPQSQTTEAITDIPKSRDALASNPPVVVPTGRVNLGTCENGAIKCTENGSGWSMCSNGVFLDMNGVPAGMICIENAIQRDPNYHFKRMHRALKRMPH